MGPAGCGRLFGHLYNRLNKLQFLAFAKKLKIPYRGLNLSARGHDQDMSADGWPRTQIGARPPTPQRVAPPARPAGSPIARRVPVAPTDPTAPPPTPQRAHPHPAPPGPPPAGRLPFSPIDPSRRRLSGPRQWPATVRPT